MTHLPYVAAAYALGVAIPGWLAVAAWMRMAAAKRRLAAVDPRRAR
jgi:cytochrome c biogenesis protein CcdA